MTKFKSGSSYYSVHALKDGTICFAFRTKKPRSSRHSTPVIDVDGIHNWFVCDDDPASFSDSGRTVFHSAIVNRLNTKRAIREQIEPKLDELLEHVTKIGERLSRLEELFAQNSAAH